MLIFFFSTVYLSLNRFDLTETVLSEAGCIAVCLHSFCCILSNVPLFCSLFEIRHPVHLAVGKKWRTISSVWWSAWFPVKRWSWRTAPGESNSTNKGKRNCEFRTVRQKREANEIKEAGRSVRLFEGERAKPVLMETGWLPDGSCQRERGTKRGKWLRDGGWCGCL